MEIRLDGRRAIVTGSTSSSSNIGYAIAKGLAEAGVAADLTDASEIRRLRTRSLRVQ